MRIYKTSEINAKENYLDIGHHGKAESWGIGYNDNWIVTKPAMDIDDWVSMHKINEDGELIQTGEDSQIFDLHKERNNFYAKGRIDHETKTISVLLLNRISEDEYRKVEQMLMFDYPGYRIKRF